MTAFSLLQQSLATYCLFMETIVIRWDKDLARNTREFWTSDFKRKSLELLVLEFGRKNYQCLEVSCIFDNPLFHTEFVAYFEKDSKLNFNASLNPY